MDINQIGTLVGQSTARSPVNIYDLVTGGGQETSASLLGGLVDQKPPGLSATQTTALSSLQSFVQSNVSGPQADSLFASIAALQSLLEFGSQNTGNLDPVFSLLAANPGAAGTLPPGTLIDQLL